MKHAYPAILLGLLLGLSCSTLQAAPRSEILTLNYRTADELLPLLQSVLGDTGRVSAYRNQLVVSAEPEQLDELRELLQQLDTPPRRLLISVDSQQGSHSRQDGYRVDGSLSAGNVEIIAGRGEHHGQDRLRIFRRSSGSNDGSLQQVQATEGYPAQIMAGQNLPITYRGRDAYGYPRHYQEYREVSRGFEVIASVQGEQVVLSIRSQQDRLGRQPGVIDTQYADTRLSGRLGEWIELGGIEESRTLEHSEILSRQTGTQHQGQTLRIKVELLE